jgi:hypothetical protein
MRASLHLFPERGEWDFPCKSGYFSPKESRVSKAVEVMTQHVENLKRMYAKEHAELEELKQVLLQNERSFNPLEDEGNEDLR